MFNTNCPVCGSGAIKFVVELEPMPVLCNFFYSSREEAIHAPRGRIRLGYCTFCGHIFNVLFDSQIIEYAQGYENSLYFSPKFQNYAEALANKLIERYDLYHKEIIAIGSGRGDFLELICNLGSNRGIGFDPSYVTESMGEVSNPQITIIKDFYSAAYSQYQADLIICRHVLEHIQAPVEFLNNIRRSVSNGRTTAVYFEVPNALFTLRELGIWDIIYEHCSYFTPNSLRYLFSKCGFHVVDLAEDYEGQFLCLEAIPGKNLPARSEELLEFSDYLDTFSNKFCSKLDAWQIRLSQMARAGQRIVIWGTGSKGVTFLNMVDSSGLIQYAVDLNPRKQNMYIPGTGQKVVSPDFLRDYWPDKVLVMNPIYIEEIGKILADIDVSCDLISA